MDVTKNFVDHTVKFKDLKNGKTFFTRTIDFDKEPKGNVPITKLSVAMKVPGNITRKLISKKTIVVNAIELTSGELFFVKEDREVEKAATELVVDILGSNPFPKIN